MEKKLWTVSPSHSWICHWFFRCGELARCRKRERENYIHKKKMKQQHQTKMKIYGSMNFWTENEVDKRLIDADRCCRSQVDRKKILQSQRMIEEFTHINFNRIISIKILKGWRKKKTKWKKNCTRISKDLHLLILGMNDGLLDAFCFFIRQINC